MPDLRVGMLDAQVVFGHQPTAVCSFFAQNHHPGASNNWSLDCSELLTSKSSTEVSFKARDLSMRQSWLLGLVECF